MWPGDWINSLLSRSQASREPDYAKAFLPAALEVVETPPSPTGRVLGFTIVAFFIVAVIWAFFGRVDIMATAPGRLTPIGDTKTIQPLETGLVRAILVQNGQRVRKGDLLLQLDPTQPNADSSRISQDLMRAELDVARLTALRSAIQTGRAPRVQTVADAPKELLQDAQASASAQWDQHAAKVAELDQQIAKSRAEAAEISAQIGKISASVPILNEKEKIHRDLTAQGYGTSLSYLDAQEQASDARHEVAVQNERLRQAASEREAISKQRDEAISEFGAGVFADLRKAEESRGELSQDAVKAISRSSATELRAPIDGVVDQLAVHTLGGVVTPAQPLMIVVPERQGLIIQAQLSDRDSGFVHAGQTAKVKVETFNFTRYGLLDGRVVNVSRDVINPSSPMAAQSQDLSRGTNKGDRPSYVARILLNTNSMRIDGQTVELQPGMTVQVEIRTGSRTILDYLLSPIARRAQDSLHER
jgi:hemolysin D